MKDDTISRRAAIDAVECITSSMSICLNEDECHGMKRMQRQAILELANMPSAQRWIPCSERLPDEEGKYLVTSMSGGESYIDVDEYVKHYHGGEWLFHFGVTAWMPLPKPYRKEGKHD